MAVPKPTLIPQQFAPDECQREAIEHVHGPMLVIAGAGTGKTTVLTRRIARLVRETMAQPGEILALTYTDNAAHEMRERVRSDLRGTDISQMQLATFHAYCNNLLIRSGKNFGVLDDKDLWIYLRRRIRELRLNYFIRASNLSQFLNDLVDEFQDANFAQVKILQKLAAQERNVFAVGDPDQAIYRFRGASSAAFALFQNQFPGAKLVALEKNRRSTSPILNCAFALISKNPAITSEARGQFAYQRSPLVSAREEDAAREA